MAQPSIRSRSRRGARALLLTLAALGGCMAEPNDAVVARSAALDGATDSAATLDTDASTSAGDGSGTDTGAWEAAPNCPRGKEISEVSCDYRLTGSAMTSRCEAVLATVLPDGRIEVTARPRDTNCTCELNSRGVTSRDSTCADLGNGYEDPSIGARTCGPKTTVLASNFGDLDGIPSSVAIGVTYPQAESRALAACEAAGAARCVDFCATVKKEAAKKVAMILDCCVPSQEPSEQTDEPQDADVDPADADQPSDADAAPAEVE